MLTSYILLRSWWFPKEWSWLDEWLFEPYFDYTQPEVVPVFAKSFQNRGNSQSMNFRFRVPYHKKYQLRLLFSFNFHRFFIGLLLGSSTRGGGIWSILNSPYKPTFFHVYVYSNLNKIHASINSDTRTHALRVSANCNCLCLLKDPPPPKCPRRLNPKARPSLEKPPTNRQKTKI